MIGRIWHGWTTEENADAYERLLRTKILPGIEKRSIDGYLGAHLLKRNRQPEQEVEFVTICWFEQMEAIKEFAGDDFEHSVVPPEARKLLKRYDDRSVHYETVLAPRMTS